MMKFTLQDVLIFTLLLCVNSYSYLDYMNGKCDEHIFVFNADKLELRPYMISSMQQNCKVYLDAGNSESETDVSVQISFLNFNVPCNEGSVKISNIQNGDVSVCGDSISGEYYKSLDSTASIEFIKTQGIYVYSSSFDILVTRINNGWCRDDEFLCNNGGCIDKYLLTCDGNNNCGDNSDESLDTCFWTTSVIAGVSLGASGLVMCISCVLLLIVRRRRIARIYAGSNSARVPIKDQLIAQPYYVQPPQYQPQVDPQQPYQSYAVSPPPYQAQDNLTKA